MGSRIELVVIDPSSMSSMFPAVAGAVVADDCFLFCSSSICACKVCLSSTSRKNSSTANSASGIEGAMLAQAVAVGVTSVGWIIGLGGEYGCRVEK